jgi:hypothetical protein
MPSRDAGPPAIQMRASGKELRQISRELRAMDDKAILKQFRKELRAAAAPFVPAVRASIGQIPAKGPRSTGLRAAMKKATTLSVKTVGRNAQVSIAVTGRKMPAGKGALPSYMEGTRPRWRHPVFGDEDVYVQQPPHPYFYRVVRPMGAAAKVAVNRVVTDITRKIT